MRRLLLVAAVALALPAIALAKGPSEASISGPGLDEPRALGGIEALARAAGLYELPVLADPPESLGPKYTITWTIHDALVIQDVYPFASPDPITYTPGHGWYAATPELREHLLAAGVPRPTGGRTVWPWLAGALAVALAGWFALARSISITRAPSASSASTSSTPTTG